MERKERRLTRRAAGGPGGAGFRGVDLKNLAGRLVLEAAEDDHLELTASIVAEAGEAAEAERLCTACDVSMAVEDGRLVVRVILPELAALRYPVAELARGSLEPRGPVGLSLVYQGSTITVTSRDDVGAPTLFADLTLRVPPGVPVEAWNGVGNVEANGLGELDLATESGDVAVRGGSGRVRVAARTGNALVLERSGEAAVKTGSGDVGVVAVAGTVRVESGSGDIALDRVEGEVAAASGSGDVSARGIDPRGSLRLSSGSGDVSLEAPGLVVVKRTGGLVLGTLRDAEVRLHSQSGSVTV